jgi:hypothetical protein
MPLLPRIARHTAWIFVCVSLSATVAAAQDSTAAKTLIPVDIHGFVQVYYRTGDPLNKDGYRIRKADVRFSGDVSPRLRWRLSVDAAKALAVNTTTTDIRDTTALNAVSIDQKSRMLQEAELVYAATKSMSIEIGQQLVPLSLEGWIPLASLETIERANFIAERSRAIGLGYIFDLGASVNGLTSSGFEYHAGVFNEMGDDQGGTDPNDQKATVGRFDYHLPVLPGAQIGASAGYEPGPFTQEKQRFGTDAQYRAGRMTFRGETMAARDGALRRFGWYGLTAMNVTSSFNLAARYDSWDRDRTAETNVTNAYERQILIGGNYVLEGTSGKIALNVIHQSFPTIGTVRETTFLLAAFQAAW